MSTKRGPNSGSSPPQKKTDFSSSSSPRSPSPRLAASEPDEFVNSLFQTSSPLTELEPFFPSQYSVSSLPASAPTWTNPDDSDSPISITLNHDEPESPSLSPRLSTREAFSAALITTSDELGIAETANMILSNGDLKKEITKLIHSEAHNQLKASLRQSILTADKKNRQYLLSLTPKMLCEEFEESATLAYQTLVGLLGVSDTDAISDNQHLTNIIAMVYSTVAKSMNRKATGYGLLLSTVARDGGMREDSMKIFCNLCHPRTAQKYDAEVLSKDWDAKLKAVLVEESTQLQELRAAELHLEQNSQATSTELEAAATNIDSLDGCVHC